MSALSELTRPGFWRRVGAMVAKEFVQLRRDRVTFATIITIPLMQLVLFGYAINTQPRALPTAVLLQESSDVGRSILKAIENTKYFAVTKRLRDEAEFDRVLASGEVLFAIEIPRGFERALRRGERPALLVAADATDPVWRPPARSAHSTTCCRPRYAMTAPFPTTGRRRSRSAPTRATTRRLRASSTSCRA
jgi:ABC-2 type transport system permease protein